MFGTAVVCVCVHDWHGAFSCWGLVCLTQGKHREHTGNTQGKHREHTGKTQGTHRENTGVHTGKTHAAKS